MDDMRKSLSKLKKDFKHRVGRKKRAADTAGANAAGETASSLLPPTQPDSRVIASSRGEEGSEIRVDVSQAHSRDQSPQLNRMQADEGGDNPQWREADVDEREANQSRSRLGPASQEIKQASSPLFVDSVPPKLEHDSTWTLSPQQLSLITLLDNADTFTVPDRVQGDHRPDESAGPSAAASEKKSSWKSTALATAKLLLRGVRDSADAFGPLKSVAGGLCFILENCEV